MAETPGFTESPTRRTMVAAAGGVGLAAVLAACGSDSDSGSDGASASGGAAASSGDAGSAPSADSTTDAGTPSSDSGSAAGGSDALAKTSEIPVGGGKVFNEQKVVVTQPTAGQFKAFSAVCTHQGCIVGSVSGGLINCPCHGSAYHVADGSVANGPATAALPPKTVTVSGGEVTVA